jgi:hypothetical protein
LTSFDEITNQASKQFFQHEPPFSGQETMKQSSTENDRESSSNSSDKNCGEDEAPKSTAPDAAIPPEQMSPPKQPQPQRHRKDTSWPETRPHKNSLFLWLSLTYSRWSYSYMNPILRKGRRQFKDGDHLELEDLYRVPQDMEANYLSAQFW